MPKTSMISMFVFYNFDVRENQFLYTNSPVFSFILISHFNNLFSYAPSVSGEAFFRIFNCRNV